MPRYDGKSTVNIIELQSSDYQYLSSTLHQVDDWRPDPTGATQAQPTATEAEVTKRPISIRSSTLSGYTEGASTYEPFSNRILFTQLTTQGETIVPNEGYDLDLLAGDQILDFSIFNGFKTEQTVEVLAVTSGQGVSITTPSAPFQIGGLGEQAMEIQVEGEGTAFIDADVTLKLSGNTTIYYFNIKGTRFNLPYFLDAEWGQGVEVTRRYLTSVFTGTDSSEHRKGLRSNPVRSVNADIFFSGREATLQAYASMRKASRGSFLMPYYVDSRITTQDSTVSKIFCDPQYTHMQAGNYVTIAEKEEGVVKEFTVFKISSVEPDGLVPVNFLSYDFPKGSEVAPAMICAVALEGSSMEQLTDRVGTFNLSASEQYGLEQFELEDATFTPTLFKGSALFPFTANRVSQYSISVSRAGASEASGKGTKQYALGEREYTELQFTAPVYGREDIWDAIGFFNYVSGRGRNFWVKEESNIFPTESVVGGGGVAYNITMFEGTAMPEDYGSLEAVLLIDAQGNEGQALIDTIVEISGKTTIVTEATSFSGAIRFYPLILARMSSDEVTENWITDSLMEVDFTVRELIGAY